MTSPRIEAARVLLAVEQGQTTLAAEVERSRGTLEDGRDRGMLLDLAAGTLRWRNEIDALVAAASQREIAEIDPRALVALRLGVYQMRHLDRIPPHALVHESVELVRTLGAPRAAGFVNAVLRSLLRQGDRTPLPPVPPPDASHAVQVAYLTTTLSHPTWLVERWLSRHGFEQVEAWCRFNNASPDVTVRPRGQGDSAAETAGVLRGLADAVPSPFVSGAVRLPAGRLSRLPAELRPELTIQDEGSQLVALAVGVKPGERVWDACASPGGKTLVLADATGPSGLIVSSDLRPKRVRLLAKTIREADRGAATAARRPVVIARVDASKPLPFGATFDRVLVDAPCSGLGTLRRDPDLKWSRKPEELAAFAARQVNLLSMAAEAVRPGGCLVYATCSTEPEENEQVVDAFLARDDRFIPGALQAPAEVIDARGHLRTLPFRDGLDGFFAAALVRRQPA